MKKLMNKRVGRAFLFALTLIPIAAIGGYFSVRLLLSSLDPSMLEDAISKAGSEEIVLAVSVIMTVVYATVLGFFGWKLFFRGKTEMEIPVVSRTIWLIAF